MLDKRVPKHVVESEYSFGMPGDVTARGPGERGLKDYRRGVPPRNYISARVPAKKYGRIKEAVRILVRGPRGNSDDFFPVGCTG